MLLVTLATDFWMRTPACNVRPEAHAQNVLLNQRKLAMLWNPLTVGQAVRVETKNEEKS